METLSNCLGVLSLAYATIMIAVDIHAGTYKVATPYSQVLTVGGASQCSRTWYDPDVFALPPTPTGTPLRLLGQANNPGACGTGGYDSIYAGTRDPANGIWSNPSSTDCPQILGFSKCGRPTWVWASPSVVKVDSRYFMAFIGGNGDYDKGKIYWAVSDSGTSWSVYATNPPPGEPWSPVIYPKYFDDCFNTFGVSQLALSYENGYFYIFMNYIHRVPFNNAPAQTWDSLAYRFTYNPGHSYGFGSVKEIYYDPDATGPAAGAWMPHSGRFVFNYDGQPAEPNDPLLGHFTSMWSMHNGGKDLEWDGGRQRWIHIFAAYDSGISKLHWQENTNLSSNTWSQRADIDTTALNGPSGRFPNRTVQYPGLWYGSVGGLPNSMYIFVPVDAPASPCQVPGQQPTFEGMGIASAELTFIP